MPKRTGAGYHLAILPPVTTPSLTCDPSGWVLSDEWSEWASKLRTSLIEELMHHGNWFSRPPRYEVLNPLFTPWTTAQAPAIPGCGTASWNLEGLIMTSSAITPVWSIGDFVASVDSEDKISLFGGDLTEADTREIQFDDIESDAPAAAPTRIRNREWEGRKFLAKERVREARLKAQIADRLAQKEESRFTAAFGDLDDDESGFSDYDLTEDESTSQQ